MQKSHPGQKNIKKKLQSNLREEERHDAKRQSWCAFCVYFVQAPAAVTFRPGQRRQIARVWGKQGAQGTLCSRQSRSALEVTCLIKTISWEAGMLERLGRRSLPPAAPGLTTNLRTGSPARSSPERGPQRSPSRGKGPGAPRPRTPPAARARALRGPRRRSQTQPSGRRLRARAHCAGPSRGRPRRASSQRPVAPGASREL